MSTNATTGLGDIDPRRGARPRTIAPSPHAQVSDNAPIEIQERLWARMKALPGVAVADSLVSVPGARAITLPAGPFGPDAAFQADREFAHIHPHHDGSLHVTLPDDVGRAVIDTGWGERHPVQATYLIYGPRDDEELDTVFRIVELSHAYARGTLDQ